MSSASPLDAGSARDAGTLSRDAATDTDTDTDTPLSRAASAAAEIRASITSGALTPGTRVPEAKLAATLGVSRNTLREAFRILSHEGLLTLIPHRGACVAIPSLTTIIDVYRVRRLIECQAVTQAIPKHPAIAALRLAVEAAEVAQETEDWTAVASANLRFHEAVFALADSPRLMQLYGQLATELRLAFGLIADPAYLHAPFLARNREILTLLEAGNTAEAARALEEYLSLAERILLAGYARVSAAMPGA